MISFLWDSFIAFNQNAWANLVYTFSHNAWFFIIGAAGIISTILYLKEEIEVTVKEEQQAL